MSKTIYAIGIDLGTSNSALSYSIKGDETIHTLEIPQWHSEDTWVSRQTLASMIYLRDGDKPVEVKDFPIDPGPNSRYTLGEYARKIASQRPDRVVHSAKSWLNSPHHPADSKNLPYDSDLSDKISAIEAGKALLSYLKEAFIYDQSQKGREVDLDNSEWVITVPASFDEEARRHTASAAKAVGITNLTLFEEPQAAFYHWLISNDDWRQQIKAGELILVCDVGGGTSDFSLISVTDQDGDLALHRIAVGHHLLLGGDNMDLALAHTLAQQLVQEGKQLDQWQTASLVQAAREGKEKLFSEPELESIPISIASRSRSLMRSKLTTRLSREIINDCLLAGFLPKSQLSEWPQEDDTLGFMELGLSYESDPAIPRHLASFLRLARQNYESRHQQDTGANTPICSAALQDDSVLLPQHVLFNGGVFHGQVLSGRLHEIIQAWNPNHPVSCLSHSSLDLAVSHGATYVGQQRLGRKTLRIRAGTARSYYLGFASKRPAVPHIKVPVRGICVVPQGSEEGASLPQLTQSFGLVTGRPARFRFFSSNQRAGDQVGQVVSNAEAELQESASLEVTLASSQKDTPSEVLPVTLDCTVSDLGTLALKMTHQDSSRSWDLEFSVREPS